MRNARYLVLACAAGLSLVSTGQAGAAAAPLPIALGDFFDTDCTQERGAEIVTGNCQNSPFGESFITTDPIAPGFPSGTVTFRKNPFVMGDSLLVANNAVSGKSQVIPAPKKSGFTYLQLLINQVAGGAKRPVGNLVITYTDKSTSTVPLKVNGWGDARSEAAWTGSIQGALHTPAGGSVSSIFLEQVPLSSRKAVASIKLPAFDGLRLFALTLSNTSSALPKGPIFN